MSLNIDMDASQMKWGFHINTGMKDLVDWSYPLALTHISIKELAVVYTPRKVKLKKGASLHLFSDNILVVSLFHQRWHDSLLAPVVMDTFDLSFTLEEKSVSGSISHKRIPEYQQKPAPKDSRVDRVEPGLGLIYVEPIAGG